MIRPILFTCCIWARSTLNSTFTKKPHKGATKCDVLKWHHALPVPSSQRQRRRLKHVITVLLLSGAVTGCSLYVYSDKKKCHAITRSMVTEPKIQTTKPDELQLYSDVRKLSRIWQLNYPADAVSDAG